jgi:hypothetical protein
MSLDIERFIAGLHDYLERAFKPMAARLKAVEARIAELEQQQRKGMCYRGVWRAEAVYRKGEWVTRDGSMWHAQQDTTPGDRPGDTPSWQLVVKRGRDGRDAPGVAA